MGHVWVKAKICSMDKSKCVDVDALVDTGATLSVIPRRIAEELGITIIRKDKVETGAGTIYVDRGVARIFIENMETIAEVWVSDIIDRVIIGTVTLESLGLKVDPRTGKLEPAPLLLYFIDSERGRPPSNCSRASGSLFRSWGWSLGRDLNPGPPPYQGGALTRLGYRGTSVIFWRLHLNLLCPTKKS